MSTQTQKDGGGGRIPAGETLTVTDNRTGKDLRGADHGRHRPGHDFRQMKGPRTTSA
jgi:hypothetical protein